MVIKLTPEQAKHYSSLRWLFLGQRGSGRSMLLALIYIELALNKLGTIVHIHDHDQGFHSDRRLLQAITHILSAGKYQEQYLITIDGSMNTLRMDILPAYYGTVKDFRKKKGKKK